MLVTDLFKSWYEPLTEAEQEAVLRVVSALEMQGVNLGHPYSTAIKTAKRYAIRELRTQHGRGAIRVLYAFDPNRDAVLLLGGFKRRENWYADAVPKAEEEFRNYLLETKQESKQK